MPSPTPNPFVLKIFPVTPFNSKISTTVPSYRYKYRWLTKSALGFLSLFFRNQRRCLLRWYKLYEL